MRLAVGAMLMMTSGCMAPAMGEESLPVQGETPGYRCDASGVQSLIGQDATQSLGARALERTGARTIRWIRPGDAVTMDYREDRLNIHLDDRSRVERLTCG
jgi:hypothetical protein